MFTAYCIIIDGAMDGPLLCKGDCSAAAIRAADGRRTFNLTTETKKQNKGNKETKQRKYSSKTAKTKKKYNVTIEAKQQKVTTITR